MSLAVGSTGPLFGGDAWPLGSAVGFVERPFGDVIHATENWFKQINRRCSVKRLGTQPLLETLLALAPLQMPSGRDVLIGTVGPWTMHASNSRSGGDSGDWAGVLSRNLKCRGVAARHVPATQYPYPSTQLELFGPTGKPPLMYVRTISAGIYDEGRWRFEARGTPQPFETPERYTSRRIRDRFDRATLIEYLSALGIYADDPSFFTTAILFERRGGFERWTATLAQAREERLQAVNRRKT